jgi:hypothetical protein
VPWSEEGVTRARIEVDRGVTLEVTVLGEDGQPHASPKTLQWKAATSAKPEEHGILVIGLPEAGRGRSREFSGGVVRVAGFKPGSRVELTVEEPERCPVREAASFPPVETLYEVSLVRGEPAPRIEIPLVDAAGAPVTGEKFEVSVSYDRKKPEAETPNQVVFLSAPTMANRKELYVPDTAGIITRCVEPYRSGRVQVERPRPSTGGAYAMAVNWGLDAPGARAEGEAFPELAPGVTHRLDAVHLPAEEIVASGVVRDAEGKPVSGAQVQVLRGGSPPPSLLFPPEGRRSRSRRIEPEGLRTRSEADGSFVIRAPEGRSVPPGSLLFATQGDDAVSELLPFDAGDTGIEVRLTQSGSLEGALLSTLAGGQPWIRLHPRSGGGVAGHGEVNPLLDLATRVESDGSFVLAGLPAGTYDAVVSLFNFEVLEVPGIIIRQGQATRDPRLDGVTVGQQIIEAVIRVRDPGGTPIEDASVRLEVEAGRDVARKRMRATTDAEGRAAIHMLSGSTVDAAVDADGYRRWRSKGVTFPLDVVMDPGCRLEIVVDGAAELGTEEPKRLYEVEISSREEKDGVEVSSPVRSQSFDPAKGKVAFGGLSPGPYSVALNVGRALRIEGADFFIHTMTGRGRSADLGQLTIREGDRTKLLRVRLTADQIAKLLEE